MGFREPSAAERRSRGTNGRRSPSWRGDRIGPSDSTGSAAVAAGQPVSSPQTLDKTVGRRSVGGSLRQSLQVAKCAAMVSAVEIFQFAVAGNRPAGFLPDTRPYVLRLMRSNSHPLRIHQLCLPKSRHRRPRPRRESHHARSGCAPLGELESIYRSAPASPTCRVAERKIQSSSPAASSRKRLSARATYQAKPRFPKFPNSRQREPPILPRLRTARMPSASWG